MDQEDRGEVKEVNKMFKYKGGEKGGKGTYWNLANGARVDIAEEDILPGDEKSAYVRAHSVVVLLASPLTGMFYVIALPFIIVVTTATLIGEKILSVLFNLLGPFVSFGWRPKEAHFGGKKRKRIQR
jgi:hypothetical protein